MLVQVCQLYDGVDRCVCRLNVHLSTLNRARLAGPGVARHVFRPSTYAASLASLPFIGSDLDQRDN